MLWVPSWHRFGDTRPIRKRSIFTTATLTTSDRWSSGQISLCSFWSTLDSDDGLSEIALWNVNIIKFPSSMNYRKGIITQMFQNWISVFLSGLEARASRKQTNHDFLYSRRFLRWSQQVWPIKFDGLSCIVLCLHTLSHSLTNFADSLLTFSVVSVRQKLMHYPRLILRSLLTLSEASDNGSAVSFANGKNGTHTSKSSIHINLGH